MALYKFRIIIIIIIVIIIINNLVASSSWRRITHSYAVFEKMSATALKTLKSRFMHLKKIKPYVVRQKNIGTIVEITLSVGRLIIKHCGRILFRN